MQTTRTPNNYNSAGWANSSSSNGQKLRPCRDGSDCQLQHNDSSEHNRTYSHPCRWLDQCRDRDNHQHTRQFTHSMSEITTCRYGSTNCTKLGDPEHRSKYRHDGLPYFLLPCRYGGQCRDRSVEHLTKYKHSTSFNGEASATSNPSGIRLAEKLNTDFTQNLSTRATNAKEDCKYGADCRMQSDAMHCGRFQHPTTSTSFAAPAAAAASSTRRSSNSRTSNIHTCSGGDDMQKAYRIGGALALETLSQQDQATIKNMRDDAIIVVPGTYDHIDQVLTNLNIKFITVQPHELLTYPLRTYQTVYINCASNFPNEVARRLREYVEKGLHIITTDWALSNVLQVAFSDFVRHNGRSTQDEVIGIQVAEPNHPLVSGFLPAAKHAEPQWWLESSSHLIEIVNKQAVQILIRSQALHDKYNSDAVVITFDCGKGNVIHMISHFYLQRSETPDSRHKMPAQQYAQDVKASTNVSKLITTEGQNLNYAQIQSSSTSAQFIYNQISRRLTSTNQTNHSSHSQKHYQ